MSFIEKMIIAVVKDWLHTRALKLPAAKEQELAKKFNVSVSVVQGLESSLADYASQQLDNLKF